MSSKIQKKYNEVKERYQNFKKSLVSETKEEDEVSKKLGKDWNELGYHRTIASFFYYIWMLVPEGLFGLVLLPLLQYTEFRFPEITGFRFASVGVFSAMYAILDLNLKDAIDRFVPEYVIKDPRTAMQYVSFFVKYQMWSGLIQILIVALMVQFYLLETAFAYVAFYMLFESVKQYPATLSLFTSLLGSFQRFNKKTNIVILRASFIEPVTKIVGGLLGIWWGINNPRFGEMFGLALGWAIGGYVDDFFTFSAGTWMLSKVLDDYGIKIREIYIMKVPKKVWKSALGYSARLWPNTIFGAIMGLSGFMIVVHNLPGYLTYKGLTGKAEDISTFVSGFADDILGSSQPALSEAYNNDKIILTKYYIASGLKYWTFMFMLLGSINILGLPIILEIAFEGGWLPETWALIAEMVPIYILIKLFDPFKTVADKMIAVSDHPEINAINGILATCLNLFFTWFFLVHLEMAWLGLILIPVPSKILEFILKWTFMYKKLIKLDSKWWKDIAWQVFIAPILSGLIFVGYLVLLLYILWPIITEGLTGMTLILTGAPIIILALVGGLFLYMPFYSYLGGWDENTLKDFKKCIPLTGPSLIITYPLFKIARKYSNKSPFKKYANFDMGNDAYEELLEVAEIRADRIEQNDSDN
ncbi:MAG: hypothetical protein GF364_08000 [Candidatus Lokiarchaeota archaeon]|nr:hypothetical protein [Candidatus Lokiarchaeota archaeon]